MPRPGTCPTVERRPRRGWFRACRRVARPLQGVGPEVTNMKTIDIHDEVLATIEGGNCWTSDVIGAIDQVLWTNFSGSVGAFLERWC
jgi:hypothetical protein